MKRKALTRILPALALCGIALALARVNNASAKKPTSTAKPSESAAKPIDVGGLPNLQRPISQANKQRLARFEQTHTSALRLKQARSPTSHSSKGQIAAKYGLPAESIGKPYRIDGTHPYRYMDSSFVYWVFYNAVDVAPFDLGSRLDNKLKDSHVRIRLANLDPSQGYLVECAKHSYHPMYLSWPSRNLETSTPRGLQTISMVINSASEAILYLHMGEHGDAPDHARIDSCEVRQFTPPPGPR